MNRIIMADEPKTQYKDSASSDESKGQGAGSALPEVSATDLMSLWGSEPKSPAPVKVEPPTRPTVSQPSAPVPQAPEALPWQTSKSPPRPDETDVPKPNVAPQKSRETKPAKSESSEKLKTSQVVEGQLLVDQIDEEFVSEEDEEFKGESPLREFLREINFSKKHIFYALGCVALVAILIIVGIWVYGLYRSANDDGKTERDAEKGQTSDVVGEEQTGISASKIIGEDEFISPRQITSTGLDSTVAIGTEPENISGISYYLDTFRSMQNAYATNVKELLDKSLDRRARLESYIILLKNLYSRGREIHKEISARMELLQAAYASDQQNQTSLDQQFFQNIDDYNGDASEKILGYFIHTSKVIVEVRSEFKAMQKIKAFYSEGLPKFEKRILDLELNSDALVSGITVFDVAGSELDLVVPVEAGDAEEDSFNSNAFPFLDTTGKEGKDYITQPGGGFEEKEKQPASQ